MSNQQEHQDNSTVGRWSHAEHSLFLKGLEVYGKNWKEISKLVGTRSGTQIRSHAQKYFEKKSKADSPFGFHEGNGECLEKLSATAEPCSYFEEETCSDFSYFFSGISKYLKKSNKLCFWSELIEEGEKNSAESKSYLGVSKRSFKLCEKSGLEREIIIVQQAGQQI